MKLPGWSCAASYFFIMSHTAEYPMARSDQDSIRAPGGAPILIRNAGVKEEWRNVRQALTSVCRQATQVVLLITKPFKYDWPPGIQVEQYLQKGAQAGCGFEWGINGCSAV
eukprot:1155872-Pelagomonas_calceolata.AAC.1